jgi:hypothetical protein
VRASLAALLALALAAAPAAAHDEGRTVTFGAVEGARITVDSAPGPRVVYDSGDSDPIPSDWDTVLIQGESPDPAILFQAARPAAGAPAWETMTIRRFPGGRFWAKARLPKGPGPLKLRALDAGAKPHEVDVYSVEVFVDAPEAAGAGVPPARGPQDPAAKRPAVHSRAEWGAVTPAQPYTPDPLPWRVTLHHSDGKYTRNLAESLQEARFIQDFHIHGRGWNDIAYHFLVDPEGDIIEGRPEGTLGAHTLGNNEGNVGIVLLGTYHPPVNNRPTKAQLDAVAALGRYLVARYGIDPSSLKGHRDYKQTDCPGDIAYAKLDALRLAFAGLPMPAAVVRRSRRKPAAPLAWLAAPSFDGAAAR